MRLKDVFLISIFLFLIFPLSAQAVINTDLGGDEEENSEEGTSSADWDGEDLFYKTLPQDIASSSYDELRAWCLRLGLSEAGTRSELQVRLYQHYGVEAPSQQDAPEGETSGNITIRQTRLLEHFGAEGDDRNIIRFAGDVILEFSEDDGTVHKISADVLIFNKDEQLLSAYGNVVYSLTKAGSDVPEVFSGNSLVFDVDSWAGMFFMGMSQRESGDTAEDAVMFYYSGDVIYRSPNDTVIMDDGVVTTCEEEDPHLRIKAKKIWVLAPGEWAMLNGWFYVGRVPIFYIPAFLKNGDPLFFNPVIGFSSDRGYFLQTTTYLLGKKEKSEDDDSLINFMQIAGEENLDREIQGLFLRPVDNLSPRQRRRREYAETTDSMIKATADVYSLMGFAAGLYGRLNSLGPLQRFEFFFGLGKSREVFYDRGFYTPWETDAGGSYVSNWEDSYFLMLEVPFRFGVNLSAQVKLSNFNLTLEFPFYSDPYYLIDFDERKEDFNFDELLDMSDGSSGSSGLRRSGTSSKISSQNWAFNLTWSPAFTAASPWISSFRINRFNNAIKWASKDFAPASIKSSIDSFLYPDNMTYLDYSVNFSGTLLDRRSSQGKPGGGAASQEEIDGMISPWPDEDSKPAESGSQEDFLLPQARKDAPIQGISAITDYYRHSLTWSLIPEGSIYGKFDSSSWREPEDIDYKLDYQVFRGSGSGTLNYSLSFFDDKIRFSNVINATARLNEYFYRGTSLTDSTWQNYLEQAKAVSNLRVSDSFSATITPFGQNSVFRNSSIAYSLGTYLFRWQYNSSRKEFENLHSQWTKDSITNHKTDLNLRFLLFSAEQTLSFSVTLPPLDSVYSGLINLNTGPLNSYVSQRVRETANDWVWDPLFIRETLKVGQELTVGQELYYDWEKNTWDRGSTTGNLRYFDGKVSLTTSFAYDLQEIKPENASFKLRLWNFNASFLMRNTLPYTYQPANGWVAKTENEFIPASLTMQYKQTFSPPPFWKNRIAFQAEISTTWDWNLIQFTESPFTFDLKLSFEIYKFLSFTVSTSSQNRAAFRYFPFLAERVGVEPLNPFTDLLKSFNFFDIEDRLESNFNLNNLSLGLVHDLHDWELTLEYKAAPELIKQGTRYDYEWRSSFSIFVQWKAWKKLEAKVEIEDNILTF